MLIESVAFAHVVNYKKRRRNSYGDVLSVMNLHSSDSVIGQDTSIQNKGIALPEKYPSLKI